MFFSRRPLNFLSFQLVNVIHFLFMKQSNFQFTKFVYISKYVYMYAVWNLNVIQYNLLPLNILLKITM